jgi:hypothetical protein
MNQPPILWIRFFGWFGSGAGLGWGWMFGSLFAIRVLMIAAIISQFSVVIYPPLHLNDGTSLVSASIAQNVPNITEFTIEKFKLGHYLRINTPNPQEQPPHAFRLFMAIFSV